MSAISKTIAFIGNPIEAFNSFRLSLSLVNVCRKQEDSFTTLPLPLITTTTTITTTMVIQYLSLSLIYIN